MRGLDCEHTLADFTTRVLVHTWQLSGWRHLQSCFTSVRRRSGMNKERQRRAFRGGPYRVVLVTVPRGIQLNGIETPASRRDDEAHANCSLAGRRSDLLARCCAFFLAMPLVLTGPRRGVARPSDGFACLPACSPRPTHTHTQRHAHTCDANHFPQWAICSLVC